MQAAARSSPLNCWLLALASRRQWRRIMSAGAAGMPMTRRLMHDTRSLARLPACLVGLAGCPTGNNDGNE